MKTEAYSVQICDTIEDRERFESECDTSGLALPVPYRAAWDRIDPSAGTWLVAVRSAKGVPAGALVARAHPTRSMPGHLILRVERYGAAGEEGALQPAVDALGTLARKQSRLLRVHLELFSRNEQRRAAIRSSAFAAGFRESRDCRMYEQTIAVDLSVSEGDLLGSFHPTARRHIRALEKRPLTVRMITEPTFHTRLTELGLETQARSGGQFPYDWRELIRLATDRPALARLIGLFRTDRSDASAVVAFALGLNHGTEIEYSLAGSTRPPDLRVPLGYALVWDLMRWGQRCGSQWFDFGGAPVQADSTVGRPDDGISEFKRYFSRCHAAVGGELVLVTAPVRSQVADYVSAGANWLRGLHQRLRTYPLTAVRNAAHKRRLVWATSQPTA